VVERSGWRDLRGGSPFPTNVSSATLASRRAGRITHQTTFSAVFCAVLKLLQMIARASDQDAPHDGLPGIYPSSRADDFVRPRPHHSNRVGYTGTATRTRRLSRFSAVIERVGPRSMNRRAAVTSSLLNRCPRCPLKLK